MFLQCHLRNESKRQMLLASFQRQDVTVGHMPVATLRNLKNYRIIASVLPKTLLLPEKMFDISL